MWSYFSTFPTETSEFDHHSCRFWIKSGQTSSFGGSPGFWLSSCHCCVIHLCLCSLCRCVVSVTWITWGLPCDLRLFKPFCSSRSLSVILQLSALSSLFITGLLAASGFPCVLSGCLYDLKWLFSHGFAYFTVICTLAGTKKHPMDMLRK